MNLELRPYQAKAIEDLRSAVARGHKHLMLQAPTGTGKTVTAAELVRLSVSKGSRVWYIGHQRELVFQPADKLRRMGIPHSLILPGHEPDPNHNVYVCTVQSLTSRARRNRLNLPDPDLIIIDEAHRATAATYRHVVDYFPDSVVVGLSATPMRQTGVPLGDMFTHMVQSPSISEMIEQGWLVRPEYYAPSTPDTRHLHTRMGDYVEEEAAERMDKPKLVADAVQTWLKLAYGRPTLGFASSVAHSVHLSETFQDAGVRAAHVDGMTASYDRDQLFGKLADHQIDVLWNYGVATEGVDIPPVSAVIIQRLTKNLRLYIQMVGRGLRPVVPLDAHSTAEERRLAIQNSSKPNCLILDHVGLRTALGAVEDYSDWKLHTSTTDKSPLAVNFKPLAQSKDLTCPNCHYVYRNARRCPKCHYEPTPKRPSESPPVEKGELSWITRKGKQSLPPSDTSRIFRELLYIQNSHPKWSKGWVYRQYKHLYGVYPPRDYQFLAPLKASKATKNYVKNQLARWAIARDRSKT